MTANLIRAYLEQGTQYYSEGKGAMIPIAEMAPAYAANAAEKLMRAAGHWAAEAGKDAPTNRPLTYLAGTPLLRALWERAQAGAAREERLAAVKTALHGEGLWRSTVESGTFRCQGCSFKTMDQQRAKGHWASTAHRGEWLSA